MKIKTITVAGPTWTRIDKEAPTGYTVQKITDSLEYAPNCALSKAEVQLLCDSKEWKVTIIPNK